MKWATNRRFAGKARATAKSRLPFPARRSGAKALPVGKVKTVAGEFDAYRVKMAGYGNQVKANASGWTGSWPIARTYWYAPALKMVVKSETSSRTSRGSPWSEFVTEPVKWEPKASLDAALTATAPAPNPAAIAPVAASQ